MINTTCFFFLTFFLLVFCSLAAKASGVYYAAQFGVGVDSTKINKPLHRYVNRYQMLERKNVDTMYMASMGYQLSSRKDTKIGLGVEIGLINLQDIAGSTRPAEHTERPIEPNYNVSSSSYLFLAQAKISHAISHAWQFIVQPNIGITRNALHDYNRRSLNEADENHHTITFKNHGGAAMAWGAIIGIKKLLPHNAFMLISLRYLNTGKRLITQHFPVQWVHNGLHTGKISSKLLTLSLVV